MSKAKLYGVGVGPGDPELLTAKAIRVIRECAVVAVPQSGAGDQAALTIAAEYIGDKPVLHCDMPMTRDRPRGTRATTALRTRSQRCWTRAGTSRS